MSLKNIIQMNIILSRKIENIYILYIYIKILHDTMTSRDDDGAEMAAQLAVCEELKRMWEFAIASTQNIDVEARLRNELLGILLYYNTVKAAQEKQAF